MKYMIMVVLVLALVLTGCTKKCDSSACVQEAFRNNCEGAYFEGEALGMKVSSEVSREGDRCKVEEWVEGNGLKSGTVCYYDMPVMENLIGDCKRI